MPSPATATPPLEVITRTGRGRPKQPLERREMLSDEPHHHRKGPRDQKMGSTLGMPVIPLEPSVKLNAFERECWDRIAKYQHSMGSRAWLYASDEPYLLATCSLYGRWRTAREELDAHLEETGSMMLDESKAHPLFTIEANLITKYHSSLSALGLVPTRRQLSYSPDSDTSSDGLLK